MRLREARKVSSKAGCVTTIAVMSPQYPSFHPNNLANPYDSKQAARMRNVCQVRVPKLMIRLAFQINRGNRPFHPCQSRRGDRKPTRAMMHQLFKDVRLRGG